MIERKKEEYITPHIEKHIKKDLSREVVFVAGPRQMGKTTTEALTGFSVLI